MGLMRRLESAVERTFLRLFGRTSRAYAQPSELAEKLVQEMERGKVESVSCVYAPSRYVVHLCREDRAQVAAYEATLIEELHAHLLQHCRRGGYELLSPLRVSIEAAPDLKLGFFGIAAEAIPLGAGPSILEQGEPAVAPGQEEDFAPLPGPSPGVSSAAAVDSLAALPARPSRQPWAKIVLREGGRVQKFEKSRVVIGRAREADFLVQDPNVSRRHALIYWNDGKAFLKDLNSTNGTLLNGRPVNSGNVEDGDVIGVGASRIVVEIE